MLTLTGTVDRIVFQSADFRFAVARFRLDGVDAQGTYDDLATIVGELAHLAPGEILRVGGDWERHPRHGRRFRVQWLEQKIPATAAGIERFLGSGIIKGVGPTTAQRIVAHFGETTIDVIEAHPERLREVPKMSRKRAQLVVKGWREHHQIRELMLFLQSHNLPAHLARRIQDQYGQQCIAIMQRDPYQLIQDVQGIGFKTADAMAGKLGLSSLSASRLVAGLKYVLEEASREGHVYLPKATLLSRASSLLLVRADELEPGLLEASRQNIVVFDGDDVYLAPFFYAERNAAMRLQSLQLGVSFLQEQGADLHAQGAVQAAIASLGISLAQRQTDAVSMALREKVSILTGGPGTGKTMCLLAVITALDRGNVPYTLCAPTGRAAKRMTAATGRAASTIHRLLGYQPAANDFAYNSDRPLPRQMVIVDEVSMLDILLFNHLLKAMPDEAHLLLVGDSDQLPAVGPGNVLRDLLESGQVPSVVLDELFRQAQGSQITIAAHRIRRGDMLDGPTGEDLYLVRVRDAEGAQAVIKEMVARRIPARFGLDPKRDIQVLSPMHRGPAGVSALNDALQGLLNPVGLGAAQAELGNDRLRRGDKVMQVRNNYDKDVYNGDMGTVISVNAEDQGLTVRFGETDDLRDVDYDFADLSELVLSYAVSVHKSQGSEFACVVMPLLTAHYPLLQRNLLYTAVTRAKRLCVLVYQPKALEIAVAANGRDRRFTGLARRLTTEHPVISTELMPDELESY